jgi:hypothetical protein
MLATTFAIQGCSASRSSKPSSLEQSCTSDTDCGAGEFCTEIRNIRYEESAHRFCTKPCRADSDCTTGNPYFVCGILEDGTRGCTYHCEASGIACVNGVPTACVAAGDAYCESCGCPESLTCAPGGGCVAKRALGEACHVDDNCVSDNCSPQTRTCLVAAGSPCTGSNCDICLAYRGTDWTFCSRDCSDSLVSCGTNGVCLTSDTKSRCYATCTGCPATCKVAYSDDRYQPATQYCDI